MKFISRNPTIKKVEHALAFQSITQITDQLRHGRLSSVEVVQSMLNRIQRLNPTLRAFLSVNPQALEEARACDRKFQSGRSAGRLHGVPISIKDLIFTSGMLTTAGSKVFGSGLETDREARVVRRLRDEGAIIIGKTNLHEFAYGVTNENKHFGPALNPWDRSRISGGSSGGSAVALAAGLCYGSIGTDTRGSIRIPSACCGTTGLKPTRRLVSTRGVIPLSWTLDHVGPMARNVEDTALLLDCIAGAGKQSRYQKALRNDIRGLRIGVCPYYFEQVESTVEKCVRQALRLFEKAGALVQEISIDALADAHQASAVIASAEAVAYHDEFLQTESDNYDPAVRERLLTGYQLKAVDLVRALQSRKRVIREFGRVFLALDCLAAPVLPITAPALGTGQIQWNDQCESVVDAFTRLNSPQNMAGLPALALPCGFDENELPVALQLIAASGGESVLLSLGAHLQRETNWHHKRPKVD